MSEHRNPPNPDMPHLPESEGAEHYKASIAKARERSNQMLTRVDASKRNGDKVMVDVTDSRSQSPHLAAQSLVFSYRSLMAESFETGKAAELWKRTLGKTWIPEPLDDQESRQLGAQVEVDLEEVTGGPYYEGTDPTRLDASEAFDHMMQSIELIEWNVSLSNMSWWIDRYLTVKFTGPRGTSGRAGKTKKRTYRIVLPTYLLRKTHKQLNSVFAELGEGLAPKQTARDQQSQPF